MRNGLLAGILVVQFLIFVMLFNISVVLERIASALVNRP